MKNAINQIFLFLILSCICNISISNDYCDKDDIDNCTAEPDSVFSYRYIFYDVNPPEGFNLRRDVYMRVAIFVHNLQKSNTMGLNKWKLVLPPWPHLYHWQSKDISSQNQISWGHFFDIESLQKFAPVIELYSLFSDLKNNLLEIDEVYILQHFKDMFEDGIFEEKISEAECENEYITNYYGYTNITAKKITCLNFQGHMSMLTPMLEKTNSKLVMFDHAEVALHDFYGDRTYWQARRSMRFNKKLYKLANNYRLKFLNSSDENDDTVLPNDWRDEKLHRKVKGGPYICAHLRRKDFVWGRPNDVPNIENTAKQIQIIANKQKINVVFVATDAPMNEYEELKAQLPTIKLMKFEPTADIKQKYKDGGIAIIEQIICSRAKYFIGTHESTFSFRIQEEREILGFPPDTTFNRLCGFQQDVCSKPSIWKIVH